MYIRLKLGFAIKRRRKWLLSNNALRIYQPSFLKQNFKERDL